VHAKKAAILLSRAETIAEQVGAIGGAKVVRDEMTTLLQSVPSATLRELAAICNEEALLQNTMVRYDRAAIVEGLLDHYFRLGVAYHAQRAAAPAAEEVPVHVEAAAEENAAPQKATSNIAGMFKALFRRPASVGSTRASPEPRGLRRRREMYEPAVGTLKEVTISADDLYS